jgi:lysophospholipase L1-like esterase
VSTVRLLLAIALLGNALCAGQAGPASKWEPKIRAHLPETRIVFVAIKPSIARWKLVEKMRRANRMIRMSIETDERLEYVDIDAPMIGEDDRPRAELFRKDGLHLNPDGYRLWTSLVRPHLE